MVQVGRLYESVCLIASLFLLTGCWQSASENKKADLVIINVLDKPEFDDCHIKGSINISFDEFEDKMKTLPKHNHYVLYCADYMCMSSGYCAKLLKNAKFEHVWAYEGGMAEWYQKGYPVEGACKFEYLTGENINLAEDEEAEVPTITAEQLRDKMIEFAA